LVLLIVLLIFGARKLPELARSLGSSAKEFRKGIEEGAKDDTTQADATEADLGQADVTETSTSEREVSDP
jgi:sec-independent protein translocase protein TatA